jgi:hypothetical protein
MAFEDFWMSEQAAPTGASLRFSGAQNLSHTQGAPTSQRVWTVSFWMKRGEVSGTINTGPMGWVATPGVYESRIDFGAGTLGTGNTYSNNLQIIEYEQPTTGVIGNNYTNALLRDPSAWYHVVISGTSVNTVTPFTLNGVSQSMVTQGVINSIGNINTAGAVNAIGSISTASGFFQGYLADVFFVDGLSLPATTFGYFDANGVWVPYSFSAAKANVIAAGGFGTNGFALRFEPQYFNSGTLVWADQSGNGNDYTANWNCQVGAVTAAGTDIMSDSPSVNSATFNPLLPGNGLAPNQTWSWSSGNMIAVNGNFGPFAYSGPTTQTATTGKFYFEYEITGPNGGPSALNVPGVGVMLSSRVTGTGSVNTRPDILYNGNGNIVDANNTTLQSGLAVINVGNTIGVAWNADAKTVQFYNNGVAQGTPQSYTGSLDLPATWNYFDYWGTINFGQSAFNYTAPAGFSNIQASNLPTAPVPNGETGFQALLGPGDRAIGSLYGGGYFAGRINDGGTIYDLIVAPTLGDNSGPNPAGTLQGQYGGATPTTVQYKLTSTGDLPSATAQNEVYGKLATDLFADGSHPLFDWCKNSATGPNGGGGIGGNTDWYIPAKNELEVLYYYLKPDPAAGGAVNDTSSGSNPNAVSPEPISTNYTVSNPAQTTGTLFQSAAAQAFSNTGAWWTSTEFSLNDNTAWGSNFLNGGQGNLTKGGLFYGRAIRRVPTTPAGILAQAQAAFPNGLWWIKDTVNNAPNQLVDSINGTSNELCQGGADNTLYTSTTYGAQTGISVAWCWATPASGINVTTGFSITNGTHGLGAVPAMVWDRGLNVWHQSLPAGQGLQLWNLNVASAQAWTVNSTTVTGPAGGTYYTWTQIPGYSSFGSYTGNASTDGPFVYCGFKPAFLLLKNSQSAQGWAIIDTTRSPYNVVNLYLESNARAGNNSGFAKLDIVSNGFKLRDSDSYQNGAGQTMIYAAFAENPFGGSNVAPVTAR